MDKDKKKLNKEEHDDNVGRTCEPTDDSTKSATDVYYKTQCKTPDSKVSVPTYDAVVEAKEWVDDENKKQSKWATFF